MTDGNGQNFWPVSVAEAAQVQRQKLLLIDLENCPNQIQELQDSLRDYDKVIICYASTGTRMVGLLGGLGHEVTRKDKPISVPPVAPEQPSSVIRDVASGVQLYCQHLEKYSTNRPATEATLRNSIRTRMSQNLAMTEAVLEQLIKLKALSLNGSKVIYQPTKISQLAKMVV